MKKYILIAVMILASGILTGQEIKSLGGPDNFGYYWKDSDEVGGPRYSWFDISSIGTSLNLTDETISNPLPIGFTFTFYGVDHTTLRVCANGYLSFTDTAIEYLYAMIHNTQPPNNILAPYWTDLDCGAQGNVYYYQDSTNGRFIVQYENIVNWGESTGNTFQVILNSDNTIVFQYKLMNPNYLNYCSVGIENFDGSDGLSVVYNGTYLRNSLAVLFYSDVIVYDGTLELSDTYFDFGNVTIDKPETRSFTIINSHPSEIMTGDITTFGPYSVSVSAKDKYLLNTKNILEYEIDPQDSIVYDLLFDPQSAASFNGYINITSSDTSHPADSIQVIGAGVIPDISLSYTDTIEAVVYLGNTQNENLRVSNNDYGELDYSVSVNYINDIGLKGSGGPDGYNYFWRDSDDPDGPEYFWTDIKGSGFAIPSLGDDNSSSNIYIGFPFSFYGNTYDSLKVSANGAVSFTDNYITFEHSPIPNTLVPNNIIAPYWTDLDNRIQGTVYYFYDSVGDRFIIQYDNVPNHSTTNNNTFQVILYEDGRIVYQYNTIANVNCTVGIENSTGSDGTQVYYNSNMLKNSYAIQFKALPKWLTISPANGTVAGMSYHDIGLQFNSASIESGKYYATMTVTSTDPDTPSIELTVLMDVYELTAPVNFETAVSSGILTLSWNSVPYASGYKIYSSDDPYGTFTEDTSGSFAGSSWSTSIVNSKKFYNVTALDAE